MNTDRAARDWTEDFSQENGRYYHICKVCELSFVAHKRRSPMCKSCHNIQVAKWHSMTPQEKEAEDQRITRQTIKWFFERNSRN